MSKSIIETPLLYFYLSTKKGEKKNNGEMYEKKEKVLLNSTSFLDFLKQEDEVLLIHVQEFWWKNLKNIN